METGAVRIRPHVGRGLLCTLAMSQSQAAGGVQELFQEAPEGIEAGQTNSPA